MATVDPDVIAPGGMFVLNVTVDHFTLEPINGQPAEPNHGHYHVFLDDMDSYFASDSTVHQPLTIPAEAQVGDHTLTVRLVHADHSDHVPAASTHVSLRVE